MKPPAFAYHAPTSVEETLGTLRELGEDAKVLAGGQSLVPMLNMRLARPEAVVDLARVPELEAIEVHDTHVRVEARVTHERLRRDAAVAGALPILTRTLGWVAHPAIRNRGTAVGSVVHADPAGELPALLGLLGGHVELAREGATRTVEGRGFVVGPLQAAIEPEELAIAIVLPRPEPRTGAEFTELARRHGDYALAGVGVTVTLDDDRRVRDARTVFIGVAGTPLHLTLGELLAGAPHDALPLDDAVAHARGQLSPPDDVHATAAYRRHLAGVLLERALVTASRRAATEEST